MNLNMVTLPYFRRLAALALGVWCACALLAVGQPLCALELSDFSEAALTRIKPDNPDRVSFARGAEGGLQVKITSGKGYPGIHVAPEGGAWDLSAETGVEAQIENRGGAAVRLALRVDNAGDWKEQPWNTQSATIAPGQKATLRVRFGQSEGQPGYKLDPAKVIKAVIFVIDPKEDCDLLLTRLGTYSEAAAMRWGTGATGDEAPDMLANSKPGEPARVKAERTAEGPVQVEFTGGKGYPGIHFSPASGFWDFSANGGIELDVENKGEKGVRLGLRADNEGDWKKNPWNTQSASLKPGERAKVTVRFGFDDGRPAFRLDAAKIKQVVVFLIDPAADTTLLIHGMKPVGEPAQTGGGGKVIDGKLQMFDFAGNFDLGAVRKNNTEAVLIKEPAPGLRLTTSKSGGWPGVNLNALGGFWDLSAYEYISLDLVNTDTHDIEVFVRVDNPGADGSKNCFTERIGLQVDQRVTMNIPIRRNSTSDVKLFGMHGYPQGMYAGGGIDPTNIVALTVFTNNKQNDSTFTVSNVIAAGKYTNPAWARMNKEEFFPFIDKFGQFVHKQWPGKISAVEDMQKNRETEAAVLAADKGPAQWNKWGGWENGPALEATGHFRVAKHGGKWTLVDPDGKLFFSTGMNCVGYGSGAGVIDEREAWFKELPAKDDPQFGQFYGKSWRIHGGHYAGKEPRTYDFTRANILMKYGENWKDDYKQIIHKRLRHWGINTIGNWSDGSVIGVRQTPHTGTFFYDCPKLQGGKYNFPDPFVEDFGKRVEDGLLNFQKNNLDDPWCIGFFLDNEIPWGGTYNMALKSLASPQEQPARKALIAWLQKKYADIGALNAAWGESFASWEDFTASAKALPQAEAGRKDLEDFTVVFAERYYSQIRDAIKKHAPNKLYLGDRSVGGAANTMAVAAKYCDVVSYNRYCYSLRDVKLPGGIDAPVIVGEFHFGALDRGPFWGGLTTADNQQERGKRYREFVQSALENPQIVGVHWFQYSDQATVGRGDGENGQIGFVDMCDTPYPETIQAARQTAEEMYGHRFGK